MKNEKICCDIMILHIYIKNQNILCTIPDIRSESDRIFCHFGWFFVFYQPPSSSLMIPKFKILKKWKKHLEILHHLHHFTSFYKCVPIAGVVWCMVPEIWSVADRFFLSFWTVFALLPSNNPKNQNLKR